MGEVESSQAGEVVDCVNKVSLTWSYVGFRHVELTTVNDVSIHVVELLEVIHICLGV